MTTEFTGLTTVALLWLATYLLHSTLLMGLAWLTTRIIGQRSYALHEQVWKLALVLPILTVTVQQAVGPSPLAVTRWTIAGVDEPPALNSEAPIEPTYIDSRIDRVTFSDERFVETAEVPVSTPVVPDLTPSAGVNRDGHSDAVPNVSPADTDWTIDIRPGPAEPPIAVAVAEIAVPAPAHEFVVEADEEMRRGGDEGTKPLAIPPQAALSSSPHPPLSSSRHRPLITAACALICLHLACAALRLLILAWKERCRLRAAAAIGDGPARLALDEILTSRRIRRHVKILDASDIRGPAACGWWRWRIVLPTGLDHEMPREELRALLAHELAHLVRRDTLWLWWSHALCILLPLQPLNFLARRRWQDAAEYLCDAWAVETDVQPLTMAKCLTRVADRFVASAPPIGLTAVAGHSTLSRRIERLTEGQFGRPPHARTTQAVALILTTLVAAATVLAAPQVSLTGGEDSAARPDGEAGFSADERDEGMRRGGDEETDSAAPLNSREQLRSELQSLLADLNRLNELLAGVDDSPELTAPREQMQRRLQQIRDRGFGAMEESDPDALSVRVTDQTVSNE